MHSAARVACATFVGLQIAAYTPTAARRRTSPNFACGPIRDLSTPALELTLFIPITLRQLVTRGTGCILDDGMLHAERIENIRFQEVGEGLTGDNRHDASSMIAIAVNYSQIEAR
jgi:hypothetical protein